ncbi:MAG: TrkH family potassium uptake protein [Methanobrevibacter sp.]|jgi:trk system potassium uptake protein TrkH|nr:TrkH family potassium uptake protein [Candidatus Methanovirga meridionalis]
MKYITKNDWYTVGRHLGTLMIGIGISTLIPLIIDIIYHESNYLSFIIPGLFSIIVGYFFHKLPAKATIKIKHGMIVSSLTWLWAGLIGSFVMIAYTPDFISAFFENISAWTTSGFTMFSNVEVLPHSILFLRCLEQWIGGLGLVTLMIGVSLHSGKTVAQLYRSEARDEKISPSIGNTLKKLIKLYLGVTIVGILIFIVAGMPIFDAICNTFTSISTGGISIKNNSMGFYNNNFFNLISMFIMIIGATSFLTVYTSIRTKALSFLRDIQFQLMISLIIIFFIILYFTTDMAAMDLLFHVVSAITTTGSSLNTNTQIANWSSVTKVMIILLMIVGGSTGSTAGSIKLMRVILIFKGFYSQVMNVLSPESRVIKLKISNLKISESSIKEANNYLSLYMLILVIGWLVLIFYGYDPFNALFDVTSAQGNIGLSTGIISVTMPVFAKIMIIINMWSGRLEIISLLVLIRAGVDVLKK